MNGKICMVTGASAGIGKAVSASLAARGATVVMVCRSAERGERAIAEILRQHPEAKLDMLLADLSQQAEIRLLVEAYRSRYDRLDVLINNAAVLTRKRTLTVDGIETMFAVNHLAYFLLTNLLLPSLRAAEQGRIVIVSSNAHRFIKRFDFDALQGEKGFSTLRAYALSKLENIYFTHALARRIEGAGMTVNALHPGVIRTELNRTMPAFAIWLFNRFTRPPEEGAATPVYLAESPDVAGVNGRYFDACREKQTTPVSYDEVAEERLWQLSARLTGLEESG